MLSGTVLLGVYLVLLRLAHGSWKRAGAACLGPAIFCLGLLILWAIERRRGRALLPRFGTILLLALLGTGAGVAAGLLIRNLGSLWNGAIPGLFYGTLLGIAWSRNAKRAAATRPPEEA